MLKPWCIHRHRCQWSRKVFCHWECLLAGTSNLCRSRSAENVLRKKNKTSAGFLWVSHTMEDTRGRKLRSRTCTYCIDAVELLGSVQQNNSEELPADSAVGKELPWFLGLDTCCIVPLLLNIVPLPVTSGTMQQPEGFTQGSTRTLAVTVGFTHVPVKTSLIWSDCRAHTIPLSNVLFGKKHPEAKCDTVRPLR